jgi:FlaA1/EpsC-like NDP-sugar epimerase
MSIEPNDSMLQWIGRTDPLFVEDLHRHGRAIDDAVAGARFLVVGGAGSIGGAVVRELFRRSPAALHVVDNSENNLAELVRDLRSSLGYIQGDFHAYCFDALGVEFDALAKGAEKPGCGYDYVLNFSALKHVRSEKDPYTLMRMVDVNVFLPRKLLAFAKRIGARKFFCVSTDKAANPVNLMGGSKRIMEMFLVGHGDEGGVGGGLAVSTARFANVAFSDGSLPAAWRHRIAKRQPVSAPNDIRRYFVTAQESAELCLFSILQGNDREIFFPKLDPRLHLTTFSSMAESYLRSLGWAPYRCESEDEARGRVDELIAAKSWPCYFFESDTTGEKDFEEFYTDAERVDWDRYHEIGIVHNDASAPAESLDRFVTEMDAMRRAGDWTKVSIVAAFEAVLPNFAHLELGKNLDNRM